MRIAVISDIHGNLTALEAVLKDIKERGVDKVINLGDLVFRGPYPSEVLAALQDLQAPTLRGNTEDWLFADWSKAPADDFRPGVAAWTLEQLHPDEKVYLRDLPFSLRLELDDNRFLLVHASTRDNNKGFLADTSEEDLLELLGPPDHDALVAGHVHRQFLRRGAGRLLINPGSVGLPFDGDPRAAYCILDSAPGRLDVQLLRVTYDIPYAVNRARKRVAWHEWFESTITTGRLAKV